MVSLCGGTERRPAEEVIKAKMDELTPICQMKDLPLGSSTTCRQESLEPVVPESGVCIHISGED